MPPSRAMVLNLNSVLELSRWGGGFLFKTKTNKQTKTSALAAPQTSLITISWWYPGSSTFQAHGDSKEELKSRTTHSSTQHGLSQLQLLGPHPRDSDPVDVRWDREFALLRHSQAMLLSAPEVTLRSPCPRACLRKPGHLGETPAQVLSSKRQ